MFGLGNIVSFFLSIGCALQKVIKNHEFVASCPSIAPATWHCEVYTKRGGWPKESKRPLGLTPIIFHCK